MRRPVRSWPTGLRLNPSTAVDRRGPEGWCGQTWALHHGVQASAGELPVFLEGDTEPVQHCLERLLASPEQLSGLFNLPCLLLLRYNQLRLQRLVNRFAPQDALQPRGHRGSGRRQPA
jgi:hypothetical protein